MSAAPTDHPLAAWDNPPAIAPRGTVIVVPGRGEHPALYGRFGQRISADAYLVRAVGDPAQDPDAVAAQIRALLNDPALPAPRVLAGSDGGALFAVALAAGGADVDGLVLAGLPVTGAPAAPPGEGSSEIEARTSCPTHGRLLGSDPGFRPGALNEPLPDAWFDAADLSRVTVPVLGLHGRSDTVSPFDAARERYAEGANVELYALAEGPHDALNDRNHRVAAATVLLFLERLRLGAALPEIAVRELPGPGPASTPGPVPTPGTTPAAATAAATVPAAGSAAGSGEVSGR
ncbi:hypothetical protein RVR_358 [Actinacidiphila reveromycinica]|uniref:Lysophospholipase n=1 Tax=Actinacidiphila reveromycinica TaxID=659352 RepID=A0A7U3VLE7_9ACTN|nr:lysophospholipase [Streptomyces sp. SN-593]BBA95480.1 hypothetical protein RVR_358 [Streptomyces sp. SN-593]